MRELAPIFGLHLPVELRERVEIDLAQQRLDGGVILGRIVHEDARSGSNHISRRTEYRSDSLWRLTLPVQTNYHVKARLGAVLLANIRELVGACVIQRVDIEAVAEVWNLENNWFLIQIAKESESIHD